MAEKVTLADIAESVSELDEEDLRVCFCGKTYNPANGTPWVVRDSVNGWGWKCDHHVVTKIKSRKAPELYESYETQKTHQWGFVVELVRNQTGSTRVRYLTVIDGVPQYKWSTYVPEGE